MGVWLHLTLHEYLKEATPQPDLFAPEAQLQLQKPLFQTQLFQTAYSQLFAIAGFSELYQPFSSRPKWETIPLVAQ
jgi:hypothetical protein